MLLFYYKMILVKYFNLKLAKTHSVFTNINRKKANSGFHIVVDNFNLPPSKPQEPATLDSKDTASVKPQKNPEVKNNGIHKINGDIHRVKTNSSIGPRINSFNIQMVSSELQHQIFGNETYEETSAKVDDAINDLKKFGVWKDVDIVPEISFQLPKLCGSTIEEHFWNIGETQSGPYKILLCSLTKNGIHPPPSQWLCQEGWTRYENGKPPEKVPYPDEDAMIFDIEVCMRLGKAPTLATAVSSNAWYAWISPSLPSTTEPVPASHYAPDMFIPFEGKGLNKSRSRIIIGHNVSYDRARIKEQYKLENSALRFMDTMSMHVCIGGVTSYQRAMLKTNVGLDDDDWREYAALNSLKAVYKLYCKKDLSKDTRDIFVEGTMSDVRENFQEAMKYCAQDVIATHEVLQKMLPIFLDRFPHPVTLAGMLELGTAYLPINSNWERYLADSEQTYEDLENECKFLLTRKSDSACRLLHEEAYKEDLWMWDEDWSTQELKLTKKKIATQEDSGNVGEVDEETQLENKFQNLFDCVQKLPVRMPLLPGYPLWYRKLCMKPGCEDWVPGPQLISTSVKVTPKLLNLTWEKYPLHHTREYGWGILVPNLNAQIDDPKVPFQKLVKLCESNGVIGCESIKAVDMTNLRERVDKSNSFEDVSNNRRKTGGKSGSIWTDHIVDDCCYFLKLPHKNGAGNNVGNPLAKDFVKTFSNSALAGSDEAAEKVLAIGRMLSYWRNNRERIQGQLAVWQNSNFGAILPQVVVCGTLTRRAMEPTWLTASNAQSERIGSELRCMVQAPEGYHLVGADVDSQELWIASVLGDAARAGMHASTPFGWMTLSGSKANGTDMHSVTATAAGISRSHAKVINYARIYGAGVRFAQRLLKQFNPEMSDTEAKAKATKMFALTKGRKVFHMKEEFKSQFPEDVSELAHSAFSAARVAKVLGRPVHEVFEHPKWEGGTESAMFNRLEEIACSAEPRTPFLSARMSRAVEPRSSGDDSFLTTRVNWVVQSGAADFLHLMLVSLRWLSQGKMKFCLSFHDEVRYLVPSHLRYEAALALHITNLLTRAFCAQRLGIRDLPQSVAFFSSVEVDKVLRKESMDDCVTPSNPHGLEKGYGIGKGESLDVTSAIEKSGGKLFGMRVTKKLRNVPSDQKKARDKRADSAGVSVADGRSADSSSAVQQGEQSS